MLGTGMEGSEACAKGGEDPLRQRQLQDPELKPIISYLGDGILPTEDKLACEHMLSSSSFEILDGVLYHLEKDQTLRIVLVASDRMKIFEEAQSGTFGGHLREAKIHGHDPFDRVGVDVLKFSKISQGNQYAVVGRRFLVSCYMRCTL